jgi:hypothetical protein
MKKIKINNWQKALRISNADVKPVEMVQSLLVQRTSMKQELLFNN